MTRSGERVAVRGVETDNVKEFGRWVSTDEKMPNGMPVVLIDELKKVGDEG
jgi:hypothetical protein